MTDRAATLVTLRAGAGGDLAYVWAAMLARMVSRWGERHGLAVETLTRRERDGGIDLAELALSGARTHDLLRSEHGVHRIVRLVHYPDGDARRQTAFASVEVLPGAGAETAVERRDEGAPPFGVVVRSYTFDPAPSVRDIRTGLQTTDIEGVLDGLIDPFIEAFATLPPGGEPTP